MLFHCIAVAPAHTLIQDFLENSTFQLRRSILQGSVLAHNFTLCIVDDWSQVKRWGFAGILNRGKENIAPNPHDSKQVPAPRSVNSIARIQQENQTCKNDSLVANSRQTGTEKPVSKAKISTCNTQASQEQIEAKSCILDAPKELAQEGQHSLTTQQKEEGTDHQGCPTTRSKAVHQEVDQQPPARKADKSLTSFKAQLLGSLEQTPSFRTSSPGMLNFLSMRS